jgi:hypothetical protein
VLLNVNATIYLKCTLQIKIGYKKLLVYNCNFPYMITLKKNTETCNYKFGKNKVIMRRGQLSGTVSLVFFIKPLKQRHIAVPSFKNSKNFYPRSVLFKKCKICLVRFSLFVWIAEDQIPDTRHLSFFSSFIGCITLTFPSTFTFFLLFVTVAMLSSFQSPAHCKTRHIGGNLNVLIELPLQLSFYSPGI